MAEKPKIEYFVVYEQNRDYQGDFQIPISPGIQAKNVRLASDAIAAAKKAKAWFNEEKSVVTTVGANGKPEETQKIEYHDNVIVTIETYVNGEKTEEAIWEGEDEKPKSKKTKKELATA